MSEVVHQLVAVAADAGRGKYHIYYCACARDFSLLEDLRKHMVNASRADWEAWYRGRPLQQQRLADARFSDRKEEP